MIGPVLLHLLLSLGILLDAGIPDDAVAGPVGEVVRLSEAVSERRPVRINGTVTLGINQVQPPGEPLVAQPFQTTIDLLDDDRCRYRSGEYELFMQDDVVLATRDGVDDAYVKMSLGGGPAVVADRLFGSGWYPMLSLVDIDCADTGVDSSIKSIMCSNPPMMERDDEGRLIAMAWRTRKAVFTIDVDPDDLRPTEAELILMEGESVLPGTHLTMNWSWSYEPLPNVQPSWIQRENRFRVDRLASLRKLDEENAPVIGEPAPTLECSTLTDGKIDIAALKGRVLVIDFWATWCGPCRRALPQLQTLADELADSPVTVLTVNCFEQKQGQALMEEIRAMVESLSLELPVLIDRDGSVASDWGLEGLPTTFILDQAGRIHAVHVGAGPDYLQTIRQDVIELLGE